MTVWVLLLVSPAPGGESSSDRRRIFGSTMIPGKAQEEGMGEMSWFPLWCFAWQAHPTCRGMTMSSRSSARRQNHLLLHANPNPHPAPRELRCKTNRSIA